MSHCVNGNAICKPLNLIYLIPNSLVFVLVTRTLVEGTLMLCAITRSNYNYCQYFYFSLLYVYKFLSVKNALLSPTKWFSFFHGKVA